ncbi:hypothetical protein C8Q80DRAFT_1270058 [Daedaleopsis nitida]|nr:hypothetical protein C8Q80DRAFT_1270058 [Daedaleopsis nitida]
MASSYPAYAPQEPSSNAYYANLNQSGRYPPNRSAASLDSDTSSSDHDKDGVAKEAANLSGHNRPVVDFRGINRTPSPTPSEAKELAKNGVFDWQAMKKLNYWFRKEWLWYYVIGIICLVGVILFTVYHKTIVDWLKPQADKMKE